MVNKTFMGPAFLRIPRTNSPVHPWQVYWVVTKSAIICKKWQNSENNDWWVKIRQIVNNGQSKDNCLPRNFYYLVLPWTAENLSNMSIIGLLNIQTTNISFSCFFIIALVNYFWFITETYSEPSNSPHNTTPAHPPTPPPPP